MLISRQNTNERLTEFIERFWLTESFGVHTLSKTSPTEDEKRALKIVETTTRHTGERYKVVLILKEPMSSLQNNCFILLRMERRLKSDVTYPKSYISTIHGYLDLRNRVQSATPN